MTSGTVDPRIYDFYSVPALRDLPFDYRTLDSLPSSTVRYIETDQTTRSNLWDILAEAPIPRYKRPKEEQKARTKKKAEVFTPVWVVKKMVDLLEANIEGDMFDPYHPKTFLEICCGEAPFITTRYEPDTGEYIPVPDRVGVLDRKLARVNETAKDIEEWARMATGALQSVYGYEYQADSLIIARRNVLLTMMENFRYFTNDHYEKDYFLLEWGEIIGWNIFWLDGIRKVIPGTDVRSYIVDWETGEKILWT